MLSAPATPAAVIQSAGAGAFCAGADLKELSQAAPESALDLRSQRVFDALARAPFVSVAAVHGPAVAGGFELALACDARIAGPAARFWLPETDMGLIPSAGGTTRLARLVGAARAKEVILFGRRLSAADALAWGLVAEIADDPRAVAAAWARRAAERGAVAQRLAKQILDAALPTEPGLREERVAEALLYSLRRSRE